MKVLPLALYPITLLVLYAAWDQHYVPTAYSAIVRVTILVAFAPMLLRLLLNLAIAPWYPLVERARSRNPFAAPRLPPVSVLVPAWNEEVGIRATMRSVLDTGYPDLELIVIDDGSTDGTHEAVEREVSEYLKAGPRPGGAIRYRRVPNGGKARALNIGLAMARGEIVITLDADSVMDRDAIANMVRRFADPRVAAVAGNVAIGNRARPIGLMQQLEYLYGFYFKRAEAVIGAVYIVGGAAAAYRRDVIAGLGGFDETIITEDIELSMRLQYEGHKVGYAADAVVYTEGPSDLRGLCRQRLRWKHGRLLTFYKYRKLFFSARRHHNPYLSFLVLPVALYADAMLLFHPALLSIFFIHTIYTYDYLTLALLIGLLWSVICVQVVSDRNSRYHQNLLLLAPVAWLLVYFMDTVEFQALARSVHRLAGRRHLSWQRWRRVGVFGDARESMAGEVSLAGGRDT